MKKSGNIRLILLGGISAGALSSCGPSSGAPAAISTDSVYANDYHVAGVGYYHAPFFAFYPQPYNFYDGQRRMYFYGGQWGPAPYRSIINVSSPTAQAAQLAESTRTDIVRGGFGGTSSGLYLHS